MKKNLNIFSDSRYSWVWFLIRLYVGWEWMIAGWNKLVNPAWVGSKAGAAVTGFLMGSLAKTSGAHPDVSNWYAGFIETVALPNAQIFSYLVSFGEFFVGIGLMLGVFTGIAAFFGALMNLNYLWAGTVSTNPTLLILQIFIMLAGKNAGRIGLDRFLQPWIRSWKSRKR